MRLQELIIETGDDNVIDATDRFPGLRKGKENSKSEQGDSRFASRGKVAPDGTVTASYTVRISQTDDLRVRVLYARRMVAMREKMSAALDKIAEWNASPYNWVNLRRFEVDNMHDPQEIRIPFDVVPVKGNRDTIAVGAVIRVLEKTAKGILEQTKKNY